MIAFEPRKVAPPSPRHTTDSVLVNPILLQKPLGGHDCVLELESQIASGSEFARPLLVLVLPRHTRPKGGKESAFDDKAARVRKIPGRRQSNAPSNRRGYLHAVGDDSFVPRQVSAPIPGAMFPAATLVAYCPKNRRRLDPAWHSSRVQPAEHCSRTAM
jgi:hypothetical protein